MIFLVFYTGSNRNFDNIQKQLTGYLKSRPYPDCLLATNGVVTLAALAAFSDLGIKCPQDVGLMGFCDYSWTWLFQPHLSMVDLPIYDMGTRAMKILIEKIENSQETVGKQHIELPAKLVIRDSCGAYKGPARNAYLHL